MSNIKIVAGNSIPSPDNLEKENCSFSYIEFNHLKTMEWDQKDGNPEDSKNHEKLIAFMYDKQQALWIRPIGGTYGTGGLSPGDDDVDSSLFDDEQKEEVAGLPCAMPTSEGTLIPQILVPSSNYKYLDNGVQYGSDTTNKAKDGGYNWVAVQAYEIDEETGQRTTLTGSDKAERYGSKISSMNYVTNENAVDAKTLDNPIYATREYNCTLTNANAGAGSCAILYKPVWWNALGDGITDNQKKIRPSLLINLAGNTITNSYDEDSESDESDGTSSVSDSNAMSIIVPPQGQILGAVSQGVNTTSKNAIKNAKTGSLSLPCNDLMPPQCGKDGSDYELYPLYVYTLYTGMVITNSILKCSDTGGDKIFVKYSNKIKNPIYTAKVTGASFSQEMKNILAADKTSGSEIMQWFPTLFQEQNADNRKKIKVNLPEQEQIRFGDTVNIQWHKMVGKFAYCPLFFHRKIKITMYFKGEYRSSDAGDTEAGYDAKGKYYFYPLVYSNIFATGEEDTWTGLSKKGADCICDDSVRYICSDSATQTSIYAVDFVFEANKMQRYPIELFGAICAYVRKDFKFTIANSNGSFTFDKLVMNNFSGLYKSQNALDAGKKYLGLITHLSVSSSMDGVTGNFTMDGYPLSQGIKTLLQTQSIGEADFAVKKGDTTYQIFSGYAMELSTSNSESNYSINCNLFGVNKKMEDMKLICAPFWDGDRLEMICRYFEAYLKLKIKMIDHTVTSYSNAKSVSSNNYSNAGTWSADDTRQSMVNSTSVKHPVFRVPRSCDWRSPAIAFNSGTSCSEALNTLGVKTACKCIPQLDGTIVFYELNDFGFPFYVWKQTNVVSFTADDIISINFAPSLEHKFNSIATFGFLQKKDPDGKILAEENVEHGAFYSKTNDGSFTQTGVQIPWSRISVMVESAMMTRSELRETHENRIKAFKSEIYQGNIQVYGNTKVNHIYQRIKVCGLNFFVLSIEHDIDASSKTWTTSYGLQRINIDNKGNTLKTEP